MHEDALIFDPREAGSVREKWYIPPKPPLPRGWLVYTLDFVLATLQGCIAEPERIRRSVPWLFVGTIARTLMGVGQVIIFILAWTPIVNWFVEIAARTFTRNAFGFFLRACYWKARLRSLGIDTIIDQGVEIWGAGNVSIGSRCHIDTNVRLAAGERRHRQHGYIRVGDFVHLGPGVHIAGRGGVYIHDFVGIMANSHLYSATGVVERPEDPGQLISLTHMAPSDQQQIYEAPIVIEDFAFLGMMTRVLPGVRVKRGAVVHANSELVRDVPAFANVGAGSRTRQIGWRKPRRRSDHWTPPSADEIASVDVPVIRELRDSNARQTLDQILDLHFEAFSAGVTTQLGPSFVRNYYKAMIDAEGSSLWVAWLGGRVCGFMGCTANRAVFDRLQRSRYTRALAFWRFITFRMSPVSVIRLLRKRQLSRHFSDGAELLSIVVSPSERRHGLGLKFFNIWMNALQQNHLPGFVVFTDNAEGIRFYEKNKGERLFMFEFRGVQSACYRFRTPGPQNARIDSAAKMPDGIRDA